MIELRRFLGRTPFGFRRVGHELIEDDEELQIVRQIRALRSVGLSYRKIAARLNRRKIPTKQNKRWFAANVRSVLLTADKLEVK